MKLGKLYIKVADLTKGFSDPEGDPIYLGNMGLNTDITT